MNTLNQLSKEIHEQNVAAGWWNHLEEIGTTTGANELNTKILLVHAEISESVEGLRKGKMDDHLPHRTNFEVEIADTFIRLFDIAGAMKLDLDGAIAEKRAYNTTRKDHTLSERLKDNGKKF